MNDAKVDSEDVKNGDTSLGEAIQSVRKPHLRQGRFNRFSVMGFLLPFQSLITSIVCHSPVNSRQVTIAWLIIKLIAYGFLLIGAPWAFVTGAFLIFVAIALDGSDGEIGRYKARAMTPEEDVSTFINGLYLDRISHIISTPLWPLAIAWGLYTITGDPLVIIASGGVMALQLMRRLEPFLNLYIESRFKSRVKKMVENGGFSDLRSMTDQTESILSRLIATANLWIKNGKLFNFAMLILGLVDGILLGFTNTSESFALYWGFLICGMMSVIVIVFSMFRTVRNQNILKGLCKEIDQK